MAYFDCIVGNNGSGGFTLTVTCDSGFAGQTINCSDGTTTLTATCPSASPYTVMFSIPNGGTWTVSCVISGITQSTTVVITDSAILHLIPNGSSATPTNDIQTWLHCANIWDKNYTTISAVLADTTTLLALISSNNAADYMARSTNWASSVAANSTAMTYIGANNYCANKLLSNSTWLNAICNSTYFESVLNVKVPTMTSNTTPSGVASASSNVGTYYPYKAFNKQTSQATLDPCWQANGNAPQWIGYQFTSAVKVRRVDVLPLVWNSESYAKNFTVQASNDGFVNQTVDLATGICDNANNNKVVTFINNTAYKYYRIKITSLYLNSYPGVRELQFYGRA